ncbi:hypothetical protein EMIHUDRAFT_225864 [Emiliania huxleyi CCMP1516]|uniref:Uncharacterized protein n=2 Tax=Emiliania huxleyi TaxID=2903 RepID=A0A0D3KN30_EMIH1|nr:hypothetical protein EMIHUDRAFT_225864 [Emiliania huxleyi CCMP1516]EOD37165.1 hypothetical protein EMIHUDRAFT_225864 [Emiliania huxleyi CCMP1516]|eukprot:XP_005789594.1 hypothetical protein EMIHUDRAFT_225864 [Emiliania huxleyi CCMP1516]
MLAHARLDGRTPGQRASAQGAPYGGENIAAGNADPQAVLWAMCVTLSILHMDHHDPGWVHPVAVGWGQPSRPASDRDRPDSGTIVGARDIGM